MQEGISGELKKQVFQLLKITMIKGWKLFQKIFLKIKIWMKFEHSTTGFRNKVFWNNFPYMKIVIKESLDLRKLKACYFHAKSIFFKTPFLQSTHRVSCFIFGVELFQINFYCISSNSPIIMFRVLVKRARYTIL